MASASDVARKVVGEALGFGHDLRIEARRLRARMRRIDRRENDGPFPPGLRVLDQQDRDVARAHQFPVGQVNQPGRGAMSLVAFGDDEIRAGVHRAPDDRFVRREVPLDGAGRRDVLSATAGGELPEPVFALLERFTLGFAEGRASEWLYLEKNRRRDRMKQLERGIHATREGDSLVHAGLAARARILDGVENAADRFHVLYPGFDWLTT